MQVVKRIWLCLLLMICLCGCGETHGQDEALSIGPEVSFREGVLLSTVPLNQGCLSFKSREELDATKSRAEATFSYKDTYRVVPSNDAEYNELYALLDDLPIGWELPADMKLVNQYAECGRCVWLESDTEEILLPQWYYHYTRPATADTGTASLSIFVKEGPFIVAQRKAADIVDVSTSTTWTQKAENIVGELDSVAGDAKLAISYMLYRDTTNRFYFQVHMVKDNTGYWIDGKNIEQEELVQLLLSMLNE